MGAILSPKPANTQFTARVGHEKIRPELNRRFYTPKTQGGHLGSIEYITFPMVAPPMRRLLKGID